MKKKLSVSVVIPTHSGQEHLKPCLKSILHLDPKPEEIILVFDGNKKLMSPTLDFSEITILETGISMGPGYARNIGVHHSTSDIICFIDSDIVVLSDLIRLVEIEFEKDENIKAIFGSYDNSPSDSKFLSQYRNLLHHFTHQTSSSDASTFWSGCGAIKRAEFEKLQGFNYKVYNQPSIEDIDLGIRLKKNGGKIKLCKHIQVKHLKRWSPISMIQVDLFKRAIPWSKVILSENDLINDLNLKTKDRLSVLTIFFLIVSFIISLWIHKFYAVFFLFVLVFILLNKQLYFFFFRLKGVIFTIRVIPWHMLFYFLSGLGFSYGLIQYLFGKVRRNLSRV